MPNADPSIIQNEERLRRLHELAMLDSPADPSFDRLTRLASKILGVPISLVSLIDANRQFFKSQIGLSDPLLSDRGSSLEFSFCQHVVATAAPLIVTDSRHHPLVYDNPSIQKYDVISYLGMPLTTTDGFVLGSFCAMGPQPHDWTQEEIEILHELSLSVMTEIELIDELNERHRIERRLNQTLDRLNTLRRIETELSETLDLDEVLSVAMDSALRITGAEHGFISQLTDDYLTVIYGHGDYNTGMKHQLTRGIVSRALATRQGDLVHDVSQDPDYYPQIASTKAQITVPLFHRDRLIGVMGFETSHPERFTEDAFELLSLVSAPLTVAIDNAQLYQKSQEQLRSLAELYQRVSDLEQMKTDMIRIAAHDLRNPLGIVLGYSELLIESDIPLSDTEKEFLRNIFAGGSKMKMIIDDILSLQRQDVDSNFENIDLCTLVQTGFLDNKTAADFKEHSFTLELAEPSLPIYADSAQLREAITNLIGNAIKYTPASGTVTVRAFRENDRAVFEVQDNGYGVPDDMQEHLFQPFYRAITDETRGIEGTGLGLHLVRNVINRHKGKMRFQSVYGEGSTFGFELPLRKF